MIAALLRAMRGGPASTRRIRDPDDDSPAFVRGLALGALIGAAIAGGTWQARARGRAKGIAARENGAVSQSTGNPESA